MLVSALAGKEYIMKAYNEALNNVGCPMQFCLIVL
jgi:S-adenosylmethionine:tRNA-ribosyltransferase-isomerase (queuine synthetase)